MQDVQIVKSIAHEQEAATVRISPTSVGNIVGDLAQVLAVLYTLDMR